MPGRDEILSAPTPQNVLERVTREVHAERSEVLDIAQSFVKRDDRHDVPTVMTIAVQLLAWLDEASSKIDRDARLDALKKVHQVSFTTPVRQTVPASQLIAWASVYYQFITV
jgi:hypothetical protein